MDRWTKILTISGFRTLQNDPVLLADTTPSSKQHLQQMCLQYFTKFECNSCFIVQHNITQFIPFKLIPSNQITYLQLHANKYSLMPTQHNSFKHQTKDSILMFLKPPLHQFLYLNLKNITVWKRTKGLPNDTFKGLCKFGHSRPSYFRSY